MMRNLCWLLLLLLWCLLWLACRWRHLPSSPSQSTAATACVQRLLKPRTPDDCPACRLQSTLPGANTPPHPAVTPWRAVKSRRGTPKRINTHGFACPNHACRYYRISDAQVHAPLWRWHPRAMRAHPDVAVPIVSHHLQYTAQYPALLPQNGVPPRR